MSEGLSRRVEQGWRSARRARQAARLPRYLALAVLALLLVLGVRSLFLPPTAATGAAPAPRAADLPSRDLALQFARAYLTYDAARPGKRNRALAAYLGAGQLPADSGFTPARGSERVLWAEIASDQPALRGGRAITVAAAVSSQRLPLYLTVTVRHPAGRPLQILGYPALVGAPAIAAAQASSGAAVEERAVAEVAERVLRNYLAADATDLRADLAPAAQVTLPTRRLRLTEVQQLTWLGGTGSDALLATVAATDSSGATYTLSYELGIARRERPYVDFVEVVPTAS